MARKKKVEKPVVVWHPVTEFEIGGVSHLRVEVGEDVLWFMFAGGIRFVQVTEVPAIQAIEVELQKLGLDMGDGAPDEDPEDSPESEVVALDVDGELSEKEIEEMQDPEDGAESIPESDPESESD